MSGVRVGIALLAATSLAGCSLMGTYGWPKQQLRETVEREATVEVRTVPAGGVVAPARGVALGEAPVSYRTLYTARRSYRRQPITGTFIGAAIAFAYGMAGFMWGIQSDDNDPVAYTLAVVGAIDCASLAVFGPVRDDNARAAAGSTITPIPRDVELTVTWPGWAPASAKVRIPDDTHVTVRRQSLGSFEEARVRWARNPGRVPTTDEAYHAARALAALANRGAVASDIRRAIELFEVVLADVEATTERRAEASAAIEALKSHIAVAP